MSTIATFDVRSVDAARLGAAFRELGFVALVGHEIDRGLVGPAYDAVRELFALPEQSKLRYQLPGSGGARGYTPFRTSRGHTLGNRLS